MVVGLSEIWSWISGLFGKSLRIMIAVLITTALLLFLPCRILARLAVETLTARYRSQIGILFVFSAVITASYPIEAGYKWAYGTVYRGLLIRRGKARLGSLDSMEKQILKQFIERNTRALHFDFHDGVVANLVGCGILYRPTRLIDLHSKVPTSIFDWAWDYLHQHPELFS